MNHPKPVTKAELLAVLDDVRAHVEADDSLEGFLEYSIPYPGPCAGCGGTGWAEVLTPWDRKEPCPACKGTGMGAEPEGDFMLLARYRVGNLDGQGGLRAVGTMEPS